MVAPVFTTADVRVSIQKFLGKFSIGWIPVGLAVVTIVIGLLAWIAFAFNGTFHSVTFILLKTLANFTPNPKNVEIGNVWTDLAAFAGLLTFYSSLALIAANFLSETRLKLAARLFRNNHVLVIGQTRLADRAAALWRRGNVSTLQIIPNNQPKTPDFRRRGIVRSVLDDSIVHEFGLARARALFIDLGEDVATLTLGFRLLNGLAVEGRRKSSGPVAAKEWVIVVRNRTLADHFALKVADLQAGRLVPDLPHIYYLDPERLIARHFFASHPLFLSAVELNAPRAHALIVGFGALGRHLLEQIYLTSLVTDQDRPRVTILSPAPDRERRAFFSGRSSLADEIDVAFLDIEALDDFEVYGTDAATTLRARSDSAPATAILLTSDDWDDNVRLAIAIKRIQRRTGRMNAPIYARENEAESADALLSAGAFGQAIDGFSAFGLRDDFLAAQICDPGNRDRLAHALHAKYLETTKADGPRWSDLSESLRRANCNAADHCLAKLHSLGFDIAAVHAGSVPGLAGEDARLLLEPTGAEGAKPRGDPLHDLVRLEHDRWSIERRLDGWTLGDRYDPIRQTHPLLVTWEALVERYPEEVLKDRRQIEALIECLVATGEPKVTVARAKG